MSKLRQNILKKNAAEDPIPHDCFSFCFKEMFKRWDTLGVNCTVYLETHRMPTRTTPCEDSRFTGFLHSRIVDTRRRDNKTFLVLS